MVGLGVVRVLGIFTLPFTDTTEARYAEIARKMVETRDWITPQFDYGVPFWGKPPLHTWLSALGMDLFGVNEFGARVFIFVCAIVLLLSVYRWVRAEMGSGAALASVVMLSSTVLFFAASAFVMTDLVMTLGTTCTMIAVWRVLNSENDTNGYGLLAFVGLAIGLLAKGPVALVLCAGPLILWGILSGRWREFGKLPWMRGVALLFAIAAPWFIAAELKTPGFLHYFIIGEHFERYTVPDWQGDLYGNGHERPKGAIWVDWITAFLPWSIAYFPVLLKPRAVKATFTADESGWRSYLLLWALSPMILFTPSANILAAYTLPGMPASAVLLVCLYSDLWGRSPARASRRAFVIFSAFTMIIGGLYAVLASIAPHEIKLRSERELVAKLNEISEGATPYYVGYRSYSAEFYTQGRAQVIQDTSQLDTLDATVRALAVPQHNALSNSQYLAGDFQRIGQFGRHVLFYRPIAEAEVAQ
nr:glycosyltransferase family 39 protein [Ruegeria sp. Ofav3-42]